MCLCGVHYVHKNNSGTYVLERTHVYLYFIIYLQLWCGSLHIAHTTREQQNIKKTTTHTHANASYINTIHSKQPTNYPRRNFAFNSFFFSSIFIQCIICFYNWQFEINNIQNRIYYSCGVLFVSMLCHHRQCRRGFRYYCYRWLSLPPDRIKPHTNSKAYIYSLLKAGLSLRMESNHKKKKKKHRTKNKISALTQNIKLKHPTNANGICNACFSCFFYVMCDDFKLNCKLIKFGPPICIYLATQ